MVDLLVLDLVHQMRSLNSKTFKSGYLEIFEYKLHSCVVLFLRTGGQRVLGKNLLEFVSQANRAVLSMPKSVAIPQSTIVSIPRRRSWSARSVPQNVPHCFLVITISFEVGEISGTNSNQSGDGAAEWEIDSSLAALSIVSFVIIQLLSRMRCKV